MSSLFPATYTTTPHLFKKCIFSSYQPKESKKGDGVMLILASRPSAEFIQLGTQRERILFIFG